jgi:hypothetical protein
MSRSDAGSDAAAVGESFDAWCTGQIKPWVDDHVHMDGATRRRWAGEDIDLGQPLPSDLILAAAEADRSLLGAAFGYMSMSALPASLRDIEPGARALYATGWRPPFAPGPTRDELASLINRALHDAPELAGV